MTDGWAVSYINFMQQLIDVELINNKSKSLSI